MTDDIRSFEISLDKFINVLVPEKLAQLQRGITLQLLTAVVQRTPVDTGRARGNWQVSLDTPVLSEINREDASAGKAISSQTTGGVIAIEAETIAKIKPFSITYIQNNLPYIGALEDGHSSTQAPNGMVALAVAQVEAQFK